MNPQCYFSVKVDPDCTGLLVVFGTKAEIRADRITGEDHPHHLIQQAGNQLNDTGSMCEDYLIESDLYVDETDIPKVKSIIKWYGFVEDTNLDNVGWG
jgi:hypothetical protein